MNISNVSLSSLESKYIMTWFYSHHGHLDFWCKLEGWDKFYVNSLIIQKIFVAKVWTESLNQTWNFELLPPAIRNNWWMLWIFEYFFNFYYDANFFQNCQITFPKTELVSLLWCVSGKDRAVGSELNNSIYNKFLPILVTFSSFLWFESSCDSWIRFSVSLFPIYCSSFCISNECLNFNETLLTVTFVDFLIDSFPF